MEDIIKFIKERPLLSINGLEKQCNMPTGSIRFTNRSIPSKYEDRLRKALAPYGLNQVLIINTVSKDIQSILNLIDDNKDLWKH